MAKEITDYIASMLMLIVSGDETTDREFMEIITDQVYAKVRFMPKMEGMEPPSKKIIFEFLLSIREEFMDRSAPNRPKVEQMA